MKTTQPATSSHPTIGRGIEILEARIAPATLFVASDFSSVEDAQLKSVNDDDAASAFGVALAAKVKSGDVLVFDANKNHKLDLGEKTLVTVSGGRAVVLLQDAGALTPAAEIAGIGYSDGFNATVNDTIVGDVTPLLDNDGNLTSASLAGLKVTGAVVGNITATKTLSNVTVTQGFDGGSGKVSVNEISATGKISGLNLAFGAISIIAGDGTAGFTGGAGADVSGVTIGRQEVALDIKAGEGGAGDSSTSTAAVPPAAAGGKGGSVSGVTITKALDLVRVIAGNGGAGTLGGNGGAGGTVGTIKVGLDANASLNVIAGMGGAGAAAVIAPVNQNSLPTVRGALGGLGGSVTGVTVVALGETGEVVVAAGDGGAGDTKAAGAGGNVQTVLVDIVKDQPHSVSSLTVTAGLAGEMTSQLDVPPSLAGANGGSLSGITSNASLGAFNATAGQGGGGIGGGNGGTGGSVSTVKAYFAESAADFASVTIAAGVGGAGFAAVVPPTSPTSTAPPTVRGASGGNGGSVTGITMIALGDLGIVNLTAGNGGVGDTKASGAGGNLQTILFDVLKNKPHSISAVSLTAGVAGETPAWQTESAPTIAGAKGGSISAVTANAQVLGLDALAGDGSGGAGTGAGGAGGAISGFNGLFGDYVNAVAGLGGQGGEGGSGGAGGSISGFKIAAGNLNFTAGTGGAAGPLSTGAGGAGGAISGIAATFAGGISGGAAFIAGGGGSGGGTYLEPEYNGQTVIRAGTLKAAAGGAGGAVTGLTLTANDTPLAPTKLSVTINSGVGGASAYNKAGGTGGAIGTIKLLARGDLDLNATAGAGGSSSSDSRLPQFKSTGGVGGGISGFTIGDRTYAPAISSVNLSAGDGGAADKGGNGGSISGIAIITTTPKDDVSPSVTAGAGGADGGKPGTKATVTIISV